MNLLRPVPPRAVPSPVRSVPLVFFPSQLGQLALRPVQGQSPVLDSYLQGCALGRPRPGMLSCSPAVRAAPSSLELRSLTTKPKPRPSSPKNPGGHFLSATSPSRATQCRNPSRLTSPLAFLSPQHGNHSTSRSAEQGDLGQGEPQGSWVQNGSPSATAQGWPLSGVAFPPPMGASD